MYYPDYKTFEEYSRKYNVIPVSIAFSSDMETSVSLFKKLEKNKNCFLLESVEGGEKWARYSFIGRNPFIVISSYGNNVKINYRQGRTEELKGNPVYILSDLMEKYKSPDIPDMPRFYGGAVGYLGYDMIRHFEKIDNVPLDDIKLPESSFMLVDEVIVFDHLLNRVIIVVNAHMGDDPKKSYEKAVLKVEQIYNEIKGQELKNTSIDNTFSKKQCRKTDVKSNISKEHFCSIVKKAKEYIKNGDIFQVVLSQRFSIKTGSDPFDVYRILRTVNPSPYMYYLKFDDFNIAGASPELLMRVNGQKAETCPIAGTRPRGKTSEEDKQYQKELLNDKKEMAEHTMLVDLSRNDMGKICEFGTVKVKDYMHIEKFSHVMHIVTSVIGKLKEKTTQYDALMAVLPAGTLSGAPKIRAMEIIDELEDVKRGIYGGAVGYFGFNQCMDSCITIRTIVFKDKKAYIQAGAGIVADSVPETEYEETRNKAMATINAIQRAEELKV